MQIILLTPDQYAGTNRLAASHRIDRAGAGIGLIKLAFCISTSFKRLLAALLGVANARYILSCVSVDFVI